MSSSQSPSGNSGGYSVGLTTARFLDQSMLNEANPPSPPVARPLPPAPAPPANPADGNGSDAEMSSYMSQLLKRNGQAAQASAPVQSQRAEKPQGNEAAEQSPANPVVEELPWTEAQYIPKKQAPEREADLRAFRQLANASARGALNSFEQKKQKDLSNLSGILAGVSLLAAVPLYLWGNQFGDQWGVSAVLALLLAGGFGYFFYRSRRQSAK